MRARTRLIGLLVLVGIGGCVVVSRSGVDVESLDPETAPAEVTSPVRAHLRDGSVVLFPEGGRFAEDSLFGRGQRYGLALDAPAPVAALPLDSVVAVETYTEHIDELETLVLTVLATGATSMGIAALSVAVFGSCPTTYRLDGDEPVLVAESFSNSIAPLFEMRDVDRIGAQPDAAGRLTLEVRNEALETHYVNHLDLVEVTHGPDEAAYPAPEGRAWVTEDERPPHRATDRTGRDVRATLAEADGEAYASAPEVLAAVSESDLLDHLDLTVPAPATDSAAVVLRLRNSLLSTVLFYEFMLAGQGPEALDWIGRDLQNVGTVVGMGDFYLERMGLRVLVHDGTAYREVGRVTEVGPIAWSDVAVPVPVPQPDSLRVRLRFVTDAWRIDRAAVAGRVRGVSSRTVPLAEVQTAEGASAPAAHARLGASDTDYHVTTPGERFRITFEPGPAAQPRTLFLAAQGYYIEWMRGDWLRQPHPARPFVASDSTLAAALHRWREAKPDYEARFFASRIPVE